MQITTIRMQGFNTKILWIFYIISAALFFFYILFPSDAVKAYLADQVRQVQPGLAVTIGQVKPGFPPGLKLYDVNLYHLDQALAEMENVRVSPEILSLFLSSFLFYLLKLLLKL